MGKTFYIGDLHIGHEKILWLDNRPFRTVEEMDRALILNWQDAVTENDTVYVVGDMFWKTVPPTRRKEIMESLPGRKILVRGNHDAVPEDDWAYVYWEDSHETLTVKDGDASVYLSHYPSVAFPDFYKNAVHLYAHVHVSFEAGIADHVRTVLEDLYLKPCRMYNVGCMMPWMGYTPRTLEEIETGCRKTFLNSLYGAHKPEVSRMLTLSSGHISEEAANMLDSEPDTNHMGLSVYGKSSDGGESYGWFIYLPGETPAAVPDCLKRCIETARSLGCGILCLDPDGPEYPGLETYDW